MLFCINLPNITYILDHLLRKYDVISIFQNGSRGRSILLSVSCLLMSLPSEGQSLSANQILSTYLNWRLRYNYFRFRKKQTSAILEIYFRFRFQPFSRNLRIILHQATEFRQIEATTAEIWRHIHFLRWRLRRLNTTSGFVSVDAIAFRRSKSISKPNFVQISQLSAEI